MEVEYLDIRENYGTTSVWMCSLPLLPVEDPLALQREKVERGTEPWGTPTFKGQAEKETLGA